MRRRARVRLRPDSPLSPLRSALLEGLAAGISGLVERARGDRPDPLLVTGVLVALEGVSHRLHEEGVTTGPALERARQVMHRILMGSLAR